jgi:hypothetical protein
MVGYAMIVFLLVMLPIIAVAVYLTSPGSGEEKERVVLALYLLSCINWAAYVLFRWTEKMERMRIERKGREEGGGGGGEGMDKDVYVIGRP